MSIQLKQGEQKTVQFTITQGGVVVDVSTVTVTWTVEECPGTALFTKIDSNFDKTQGASGILKATVLEADTLVVEPNVYVSELKIVFPGSDIEKSQLSLIHI